MTIYLFDGTMDGLLTAVITGSVPHSERNARQSCQLAHPSTNYSCGNQYLITSYFIKALHHQRILM